jgi:hypothetical protein
VRAEREPLRFAAPALCSHDARPAGSRERVLRRRWHGDDVHPLITEHCGKRALEVLAWLQRDLTLELEVTRAAATGSVGEIHIMRTTTILRAEKC